MYRIEFFAFEDAIHLRTPWYTMFMQRERYDAMRDELLNECHDEDERKVVKSEYNATLASCDGTHKPENEVMKKYYDAYNAFMYCCVTFNNTTI